MRYLNSSGSRWVEDDMRFVLVHPDGRKQVRKAVAYESLGNFARIVYRLKGKTQYASPKAHDGSDMRDHEATGLDALHHVFLS